MHSLTTKQLAALVVLMTAIALPTVALSQSLNAVSSSTVQATSSPEAVTPVNTNWFKVQNIQLRGRTFNDFVISPGHIEVEIEPGESKTVEISVANRLSDNRRFLIDIEDFTSSDDLSRPVVLLGDSVGPYTLKDYILIPDDEFRIGLGSRAVLPITISIPEDAEPGGRYGSVVISTVGDKSIDDEGRGAISSSPIVARVGTLFFVTIPGDIEYQGLLQEFSLKNSKWWYESGPIDFSIVYENSGSVHVNPYGELEIKNLFGEVVGFVEIEPWFALPNSLRLKELSWDRELLFGRYSATLRLNRGYDDIIDESTVSFWVLPWKMIVGIFIVVFILVFIIRYLTRNFEFKRK